MSADDARPRAGEPGGEPPEEGAPATALDGAHDTSGPRLSWVLGGVGLLVLVMGVLAAYRYDQSEAHFAAVQREMDEKGKTLDPEGCVDAILEWHASCTANGPLCDHGVPKIMTHCLKAQDRTAMCESLDLRSARAQWVWGKCKDRGTPCKSRKKCPCADAYRAMDSFCRHGQAGIAM